MLNGLLDRLRGGHPGAEAPRGRPVGVGLDGKPYDYSEDAGGLDIGGPNDPMPTLDMLDAIEDARYPLKPKLPKEPDPVSEWIGDTSFYSPWGQNTWQISGRTFLVYRYYRFRALVVDILGADQEAEIAVRRRFLESRGIAYAAYLTGDEMTEALFMQQVRDSRKRAARAVRSHNLV